MTTLQPESSEGLSQAEAERCWPSGTRIALASGEELFHLGDTADSLYLVRAGASA